MKARFVLLPVGLGLVLAAALWQVRQARSQQPSVTENESPASTTGALEDLSRIEAELALAKMRLARLEAKGADAVRTPVPTPPSAAAPPKESKVIPAEQVEQLYLDRIEKSRTEPRDESWAKGEEDKIQSAAMAAIAAIPGDANRGMKIESLSCRTTMCTMVVTQQSIQASMGFGRAFQGNLQVDDITGAHYQVLKQREDGTFPLQISMYRSGYPMPGVTEAQ